jgi:hypothetical protein
VLDRHPQYLPASHHDLLLDLVKRHLRSPWPGQPARQCHQFPDRPAQARDHRMVSFPRVTARQMQEDGMIMAMQHRVTRSRR